MRDAKANRWLIDESGDRSRVDTFVKNSLKIDQKKSSWMDADRSNNQEKADSVLVIFTAILVIYTYKLYETE